jgi:hypothetical protein
MALTTITGNMVSVNAIQGTLIADNAITAVHIATNAVSGTLIADNAVTAVHIAQNSITVTQLADDCVESDKIADGIITTNHLNKAMISSQTEVTAATGDFVLLGDTSDSNNLKKTPVSAIAALSTVGTGDITTAKIADDAVTSDKIADDAVTTAGLLEGAAGPLIKSISGVLTPSTAGNITITGAGFSSSNVFVDTATTTALTAATSVTNTSSTSLTAAIPALSAGQYKVFVVNSDGKSAMFPQGILVSVAPSWSTSAGALTGAIGGNSYSVTVAASSDSAITYSVASGALPSGITLNTSTGAITGTAPSDASSTTYNFTLRATDAESQTADRAFSIFNLAVTRNYTFTGGSLPTGVTHSRTESVASRAHYMNSSGYIVPVSSAGDARFTHIWNGSAAVAQGILVEERRGNYWWSSDVPVFTDMNGGNAGGGSTPTYSTVSTTLPTGATGNARKIEAAAVTNGYTYKYTTKWAGSLDGTNAGWYTWSFYAKKTNSGNAGIRIRNYDSATYYQGTTFNFSTGAVVNNYAGNAVMEALPNGWYRCSCSGYSAKGLGQYTTFEVGLETSQAQSNSTYTATDFLVWGMQFENGRGQTSYIVNNSSYASGLSNILYRESDYVRVSGTDWSNAITTDSGRTYSAVLSGRMPTRETNSHVLHFKASGAYNGMIVKSNSSNSSSDTPYWNAYSTEGLNADVGSFTANADFKIAFVQSVTAGGTLGCRNGGSVGSSGTTYITPTQMTLGQYDTASGQFGGQTMIKYVYLFNSDIGTSTMQSLTA